MDRRGFSSGEEMDQYMIRQWNSRVRQLKGKKYLIIGNHDYYLGDKEFDRSLFNINSRILRPL